MTAVTYSTFRSDLRRYLDQTRDDAEPLLVTSKDPSANVVVINARDYDNLMENLRIYENAYLVDKLSRSMEQFRSGNVVIHELVEDEDDQGVV